MKLIFVVLLALVTISAIPVEQVPQAKITEATTTTETKVAEPVAKTTETKTEVKAETKTEAKTETNTETKTEAKTEENGSQSGRGSGKGNPDKVEETKTETKTPETKTEAKTTETKVEENARGSGRRPDKVEETKTETKTTETNTKTAVKDQALNQVMDFISQVAQPLSSEERDALKDIISVGGEILMEAEKKMKELHTIPEVQNLLQGDLQTGMFGMKSDGSIDSEVAASQMTELLSKMAPETNPLTTEEKSALHDLISGFSKAFAPTKETTEGLQKDFEKILQSVSTPQTGKHDELIGATNLISVFSDTEHGINTKLLSELTEKFLDSMEKQFHKMEQN